MIARAPGANRFVTWLQICGLSFILLGMLLAWSAACINFVGKWHSEPAIGTIQTGAILYGILAGAGLVAAKWIFHRFGSRRFLWIILSLSLLLQLGIILAADSQWKWTGDASIFHQYLTTLSQKGYSADTLGELSRHYDYRVWTRRAQPFYFTLLSWTDTHFVTSVQIFQALLLTLSLALTWRIARLLLGIQVAFWAVVLSVLMPFRWFICLDLNHHILGGVYFLSGLWLLAEWFRRNRSASTRWACALGAATLLPLMRLEGGIDTVWVGALLLTILLTWWIGRQTIREASLAVVALLLLPLLVTSWTVAPLTCRINAADRYHHESGPIGFMTRGWAPETGGEYCGTYETIDYLTEREDKVAVQASILASQAFYNSHVLLTRLLPVKMAKYFLLGYASGAEEMLVHNGAFRPAQLAQGARTIFLLAVLPLMLWGGWLFLPRLRRPRWLMLTLPCSLLCATYVLLGETSPRYSIYVQPFLFMLAAQPLALPAGRRRKLSRAACKPGLWAAASLTVALAMAAGVLWAARPALNRWALTDMRTWASVSDRPPPAVPATLAPFEIHLSPYSDADGTDWGTIRPPPLDPLPRAISFYAFIPTASSGQLRGTHLWVETPLGIQTNSLPGRIRIPYPSNAVGEFRFRSSSDLPHALRIGYATYEYD